jgi:hypothetical protein
MPKQFVPPVYRASRVVFPVMLAIVVSLLAMTSTSTAQDATGTPPPEEVTEPVEPTLDPEAATATQAVIAATQTQFAVGATVTAQFAATQTATARPRPTENFQPLSVLLVVEPRTTTGNYNPGDELTFTLRVWNTGELTEGRPLDVLLVYDTRTFRSPTEGSISEGGQVDGGAIAWKIEGNLLPGEDNAREFSFKTAVRSDLTTGVEGTVQAVVSNRGGVLLAQTDPLKIPIVVLTTPEPPASSTGIVPQGEGLFRESDSFSLLIGLFFGLGGLSVFLLGALVIYRSQNDDSRAQSFSGTTEILLLLIVLFSVIVMGVQNAIDRESINAIIGGIVGYVAGRATTRISAPRERVTSEPSAPAPVVPLAPSADTAPASPAPVDPSAPVEDEAGQADSEPSPDNG